MQRFSHPFKKHLAAALLCGLSPWSAANAATPLPTHEIAVPFAVADAQWLPETLSRNPAWRQADKLVAGRKGLALLDANNATLVTVPGDFANFDIRPGKPGLLVAALDDGAQVALIATLSADGAWREALRLPRTAYKVEDICLYRDEAGNDFVFLVGEDGWGDQWLVARDGEPGAKAHHVRRMSLPPESQHCRVDDAQGRLYLNEESNGIWAYPAHAEAPLARRPVDLRQPYGTLGPASAGMTMAGGALLALDADNATLHRYVPNDDAWQALPPQALANTQDPERISARAAGQGLALLIVDDGGLRQAQLNWQAPEVVAPQPLPVLPAARQTDPVPSLGDAADDPAIWINPNDPTRSLVLGTDKQSGLLVYDLQGKTVQNLPVGRLNNVDIRPGFQLGADKVDLAVASNRDTNSLQAFAIDPATGQVRDIGAIPTPLEDVYGLCMLVDARGDVHAVVNDKNGQFLQIRITAPQGRIQGDIARRFATRSQPEGCVADDRAHRLFIGEEGVAVWTLDTDPDAAADLRQVIAAGGVLQSDIEGMSLYHGAQRSYLIVSSQGNDSYVVLNAAPPYAVRGAFRIGPNGQAGIDGASETDGLDVTSADLGGIWKHGLLVVQDGRNRMPEAQQNYKYVPWSAVMEALGLD